MHVQNILLTGAAGKIGRDSSAPTLRRPATPCGRWNTRMACRSRICQNVEVVTGDLRDPSLAMSLIEEMDVVIHLANVKENKELFLDSNIKGTFYLLDACKEAGNGQAVYPGGFGRSSGDLLLSPADSDR